MKNKPDAPIATTYLKTYEGGDGYKETPLAFITVMVGEQKTVCIPASLLRVLIRDLAENDGLTG
jgi:hypothetical protein